MTGPILALLSFFNLGQAETTTSAVTEPSPMPAVEVARQVKEGLLPPLGGKVVMSFQEPHRSVELMHNDDGLSFLVVACLKERDRIRLHLSSITVDHKISLALGRISKECSAYTLSGSRMTTATLLELIEVVFWKGYKLAEEAPVTIRKERKPDS